MSSSNSTTSTTPENLHELIHEVLSTPCDTGKRADVLLSVIRKHHFWPALQMKKFFDRSGLVLLHNTYKRSDVDSFRALYEECRSVVLDLSAPEGDNIVVTLSHSIPERLTVEQYSTLADERDVCQASYEGTMISVYEHNGKWYFGTSSCPSVDSSRYFHPTKTHGAMLDDALAKMFPGAALVGADIEDTRMAIKERSHALRDAFTARLDVKKAYSILLVHHENRHVMNYKDEFDNAEYAELFHIATRDRSTMEEEAIFDTRPFADMGIRYPKTFASASEAIEALGQGSDLYGIVVKSNDEKFYKVSNQNIVEREECDLGNPNRWHNMLWVYMQNKPHYHIDDYIRQYASDLVYPKDSLGRDMAPTYIIHTVICTMRDILYNHYIATTSYNPVVKRFKMNVPIDSSYSPMLRFHLAQLRHLQVDSHTHALITPKAIYHYLCHHQTLKNIRSLVQYFAVNGGHHMTYRQAECFGVLNQLLSE